MEKKFGKLVSNVGKNAKDILEKSKNKAVQIADQNDDGKFDLEDVTAMANSVGNIVEKRCTDIKRNSRWKGTANGTKDIVTNCFRRFEWLSDAEADKDNREG